VTGYAGCQACAIGCRSAVYVPITRADQLPKLDSDIEREVTDWKAPGQTRVTAFHKAKDVSAFSNHRGGALIIGSCEGKNSSGKLAKWEGMTQVDANNLASEYSRALEQKCDPRPTIDPLVLPCPGDETNFVLVINGNTTDFLTASELPMFMTPEVRRIAIMLARIPPGASVKVPFHRATPSTFQFGSVDEERNVVNLTSNPGGTSLPLDGIVSVYQDSGQRQEWWIVLKEDLRREL
jgi:hypothetical protein